LRSISWPSRGRSGPQRPDSLGALQLLADRDAGEWVANAHGDADELLELGREPGELSGAACEHELADPERVRLALVELERGDELAAEGLEAELQ